jgi:ribosome-interacting GTPase 1
LPADKKVVDITVRFTNGVGASDTKSAKVELVDPPPPSGTIKGKVLEGGRPQAGLKVALTDEKGATAIDAKKSNDKGEFVFENVKPGTYKVASTKPDSKTEGAETVGVEVDKTSEVTISLTRKPAPKK